MRRGLLLLIVAFLVLAWSGLTAPAQAPAVGEQPVYLRVLLPDSKAELTVEGVPTRQLGPSRLFVSPPLPAGRNFVYTLSATWKPNGYTTIIRTRTVTVQAGRQVEADLRRADPANPDKFLILYVPTPQEVANAMLKLGEVGKDDIVYDLGCGDGRIVITGVKEFGARRGVGVDIDPDRIKESKENARKAGVDDKVEFRQQDVLTLKDLADATVVMLYMGDDVNLLLRPILQKTLKPGARIVSHRFLMGDWKPDVSKTVTDDEGGEYDIHLWRIGPNPEKKD